MLNLLLIIAVVLGVVAIAGIVKVLELAGNIKGETSYEITEKENRFQARMMLVFLVAYFAFVAYQLIAWGPALLPPAASEHGVVVDNLMNTTWIIIFPVFIVTHILLFYFCWKYAYDKNRKAEFFAHSTKLELLWTSVPAIVLTILILYGLDSWNKIMTPVAQEDNPVYIELYGRQFDWTARYPGRDGEFGAASVRLIEGTNLLGLDTTDGRAMDDKIVKGEFLIPIGRPVQFLIRSQDVIHSVYMPHFRAQMNAVPGMVTRFNFVPNTTTKEMQKITNNEEFQYVLLCNKICGAAHYNMQMNVVVVSEEEYETWLSEQKMFMPEKVKNETPPYKAEKSPSDTVKEGNVDNLKLS